MARLRQGRANTARGAAHFLRETVGRVRYAGATGPLTMRADSGFYTHDIVAACRAQSVRFSITVRQHQSVRNIIEAIPEADWTPIPYWMEGAADVAETEYTPFGSKPDAAPVRLIVRRVKPTPGSQLALFTTYSYHAFITDRAGKHAGPRGRPPPPRRDRERHPRSQVRRGAQPPPLGTLPRQTPPGWPCRSWPTTWHVGPRASVWANRWLPPRPCGDASSPWPDASPARPAVSPCTCPRAGPGKTSSTPLSPNYAPSRYPPDRADGVCPVRQSLHRLGCPAPSWNQRVSWCNLPADLARRQRWGPSKIPFVSPTQSASVPIRRSHRPAGPFLTFHATSSQLHPIPSVDSGLGLTGGRMVSTSKFLLISLFLAIGALWVAFGERNASEPKPVIPNQPAVTVPQVGHLSPPNDLRRETLAQLMREALSNPDSLDGTRPEAGLSSSAGDAMAQVSPHARAISGKRHPALIRLRGPVPHYRLSRPS